MRLRLLEESRPGQARYTETLREYIARVSPRVEDPTWLEPYVDILERALVEPIRVVVAAPPQHGKTLVSLHALMRAFRAKLGSRNGYATYNDHRVKRVEGQARFIAERDGLDVSYKQEIWVDRQHETSLVWTSRKGGLTGEPIDGILLIDDILKDRIEASSPTILQQSIDWYDEVADTRCHSTASVVVMATRWAVGDLSGKLVGRGWQYVNLKAIAEQEGDTDIDSEGRIISDPLRRFPGEALCERRKSRESLEEKRKVNPNSFAALYQGMPRRKGGKVFNGVTRYDVEALPDQGFRTGYGVDLAYTAKTSADWSVCMEGRFVDGRLYIVNVDRKQVSAPEFLLTLKARFSQRRGPMRWYLSGTEKGSAQFIREKLSVLQCINAAADKLVRATPVSEAWNGGLVLLPDYSKSETPEPEWVSILEDEVGGFTGVDGATDDQVDALAALWDMMSKLPKKEDVGSSTGGRGW